jgi:hypothetical protein
MEVSGSQSEGFRQTISDGMERGNGGGMIVSPGMLLKLSS